MKVRNDFVSNSSSSSFICTAEDASTIDLFNNSEVMSLHEYLDRFGCHDLFSYWYDYKMNDMKFVDDSKFCEMFRDSMRNVLPKSAKKAFLDAKSTHGTKIWSAIKDIWKEVMPFVEQTLASSWGQRMFEYYEAEDCAHYNEHKMLDNDDLWNNNEESHLTKVFNKKHMDFSRIYSNH